MDIFFLVLVLALIFSLFGLIGVVSNLERK